MFKNATPEKAIAYLRLCVAAAFFLPLPAQASRLKTTCYYILKFVIFLNSLLSVYPVINAIQTSTEPMDVSESTVWLMGLFMEISIICISVVHSNNIRMVMELTEDVCKNANDQGRRVFQRYMEQFSTFYGISAIWSYITGIIFILKTFVTSSPFPLNAIYPFRVDYQPLKTIIFLHQALYIFNVSGITTLNALCGFLLFFAAARFEILKLNLRNVKNAEELIIRMEEYYVVKEYANFVVNMVKYVAPYSVIMCAMVLVMSGINLVQPQPFTVKFQYLSLVATVTVTVFVSALPADNLLHQSDDAMKDVYKSTWYNQSKKVQRDVQMMMMTQAPVTVRVPCLISTLSLNYFCSFLSNAFSSFSVLRAVISEDEST